MLVLKLPWFHPECPGEVLSCWLLTCPEIPRVLRCSPVKDNFLCPVPVLSALLVRFTALQMRNLRPLHKMFVQDSLEMRECDWIGAPVRVGWFQWHCINFAADEAFTLPCCWKADALALEGGMQGGFGEHLMGLSLVFVKPELLEWSCVIFALLWHKLGPVMVCVSSGFE